MNKKELERIEKMVLSAREGPWKSFIEGRDHESGCSFIMVGGENNRGDDIELSGATKADQDFIAFARQAVPALIAEVRRLKVELKKSRNS